MITLLAGAVPAAAGDIGAGGGRWVAPPHASPWLAVATGAFDGSYVGTVTNVKQASLCGSANSWRGTFSVVSNRFTTNIGRHVLTGDVHPDGSFETSADMGLGGRNAVIHLSGRITGDAIHATGRSPLCQWDMEMRR